ncbi:MAG TPA: hypothetical protein VNG71_04435 [Pyrinomonadaceae bacterium]|nr:hypothetical protein [Pyrinomonadaceae bacterium]
MKLNRRGFFGAIGAGTIALGLKPSEPPKAIKPSGNVLLTDVELKALLVREGNQWMAKHYNDVWNRTHRTFNQI